MNVEELCEEIQQARREHYSRDLGPWPKNNMTASDISDCPRESVLAIRHWRERPPFDPEVKARLERGNRIEDLVIQELQMLGYRVRVERTPFEIRDKKNRLLCRGKVDGFLQDNKDYPLECKSIFPAIYNRINTIEDFDQYVFFRKYPRQLFTYLYANNLDEGFFILDDCLGHWKLIPVRLDYERAEKILKHLESTANHLTENTLPDFISDPAVCVKCWAYKRVCTPPFASGEGMQVLADPELAEKLKRRHELDSAATEYDYLDRNIKETLKQAMRPDQIFIIGDFVVKADEKFRSMKAQPAKEAHKEKYLAFDIEQVQQSEPELFGSEEIPAAKA